MKGYEHKNLEVESNADLETRAIGIADTSFIFDILFNQMYRDPIGSVIREITSNCFDSHIEAKVDDAVVISFEEDEGGDFIVFKDVGIGISPERMDKIYKNAGTSSKRDTQDQIGYFGLGSKSPLAYTESFFLTTVSEGIKYEYLIHRGSGKSPEIQTIDTTETTERNGSEVKIYIKNDRDLRDFKEKITYQLRYFDNVYVKGCSTFNNEYTIHIGKNFKFRPDLHLEEMHICIGKVTYPIDWSKLGRERIRLPFGLKFEIGELPITPERESVRYINVETTEGTFVDTAELINHKIEFLLEEVKELRGPDQIEHNNLIDFFEGEGRGNCITVADQKISVAGIVSPVEHLYTPLEELGLTMIDWIIPGFRKTRKVFSDANYEVEKIYGDIPIEDLRDCFLVREFVTINRLKRITVDYIKHLARLANKRRIIFVGKCSVDKYVINKLLNRQSPKKINYEETNKLRLWKRYRGIMESEIILNSIDYYTIEIPEVFRLEWEAKNNTKTVIVAKDEEIIVENMFAFTKGDRKTIVTISHLPNISDFILYGFNDDEDLLEVYVDLLSQGKFKGNCKIFKIKIKDEKHFIALKNSIYVKSFMSENPVFKQIATAAVVNKSKIWNYTIPKLNNSGYVIREQLFEKKVMSYVFSPLTEKMKNLYSIAQNTVNLRSGLEQTSKFIEEVIEIAEEKGWVEEDVKKDLQRVESYLEGLDLLKFVLMDQEETLPLIVDFIKLKGKPVNAEWKNLEPWQEELIIASEYKAEYLKDLDYNTAQRRLSGLHTYNIDSRRKEYLQKNQKAVLSNMTELQKLKQYHGSKERIY